MKLKPQHILLILAFVLLNLTFWRGYIEIPNTPFPPENAYLTEFGWCIDSFNMIPSCYTYEWQYRIDQLSALTMLVILTNSIMIYLVKE